MSTGVAKLTAWDPPSNSVSAIVTATSGIANTKGTYVELIASSAFECDAILLVLTITGSGGGSVKDYLIDIAIGAAASEVVLIENICLGGLTAASDSQTFTIVLPLRIASGTRIATRIQSTGASATTDVQITLLKELFPLALTRCTTYGANTADSGGTSVDPGATINTKGVYSQLSASITNPIKAVVVCFGPQANAARATCKWKVDIATGAAASEVVKIADIPVQCSAAMETLEPEIYGPIPLQIAASTRLAARAECTINDATDRLLDVVVYGID